MARNTFKIEGLKELEEGLQEFKKATQKSILQRALKKAGAPIAQDAQARAPRLRGKLQMSIGSGTKLSRRQKSQHRPESAVEVFVGAGALVQAITQEFGTVDHPPQPFMRSAWDGNKDKALATIKDDLREEIDKAAQRAARRAARIAAKIKA